MKVVLEVADDKASILIELLRNISFVKEVTEVEKNEISNPVILQSIEDYENGRIRPAICNMDDLKEVLHA